MPERYTLHSYGRRRLLVYQRDHGWDDPWVCRLNNQGPLTYLEVEYSERPNGLMGRKQRISRMIRR